MQKGIIMKRKLFELWALFDCVVLIAMMIYTIVWAFSGGEWDPLSTVKYPALIGIFTAIIIAPPVLYALLDGDLE